MLSYCQENSREKFRWPRYARQRRKLFSFCRTFLLLVFAAAALCAAYGFAQAENVTSSQEFARDGDTVIAAVRLIIPQGYHAYAHEPGDAGRPTMLLLAVKDGSPAPVRYPQGAMQRDYYDPSATVYVYEGETLLFATLPADAAGKAYTGSLSLLLCSTRNCLPIVRGLGGVIPADIKPVDEMPWYAQWRKIRAQVPVTPNAATVGDGTNFSGMGAFGEAASGEPSLARSPSFVPVPNAAQGFKLGGVTESLDNVAAENGLVSQAPAQPLPPSADFGVQLSPRYADDSVEVSSLAKALFVGMLAGLLLNAMPCVLPVLTFKISGILLMGGAGSKKGVRRFRQHNLFFAAGIMTLFSALALVLGLADMIWGQLYQNQSILLVMLLVVFLMGLSMLGVFTLPIIDLKAGTNSANPRLQAYLSGLVSTFLATPCSGPLLGGVLGWAFTQPLTVLMLVFWAVGFGMALPYLMFCIWPNMARILPKPGAWMLIFERIVGFLLLGTALYLLSILPANKHMHVLSVLLLVALCAWLWGRFCGPAAEPWLRRLMGVTASILMIVAVVWVLRPVAPMAQWRDFTPEYFTAQLGKQPMLLEFTADWCPNCKFLEATVLTDERLRALQAHYGMVLVRVDLTNADAYAVRLLDALGSKSIPLTAFFPAGAEASSPVVLRDVYGVRSLEAAMAQAFTPVR